jgi:ribonuclease D
MSITTVRNALAAADRPSLLTSGQALAEAAEHWSHCEVLGIDTEFVRERTYRAALGLVQISDGESAWLVDPLAEVSLELLRRLLTDPAVVKVLHSGSEDLEVLLHTIDVVPDPLVDTQVACALLGQPMQMAYHGTCKWLFDVEIDKEQTRSNWCRRPLTERQLHYAAMDVVLLPEIYRELRRRLEELGRWPWLQEEVGRMQRTAETDIDPAMAYLRFAGAGRLDDASLAALRALARWREETAIRLDRARGFVIPDAVLMQMARTRPGDRRALRSIEGIHPNALKRHEQPLLDVIRSDARDQSDLARPYAFSDAQRRLLKRLKSRVTAKSAELGVDPALLASRRELENLLRSQALGEPVPERFTGWRKAVITDDLLAEIG